MCMANKDIVLVGPEGGTFDATPEKISEALAAGFRRETPEEAKARSIREWARNNPTLAGAAGAARSLSFGVSDVAANKAGFKDQVSALKTENPVASGLGEVAGVALPIAGQLGLAGKAASILGASAAAKNAATVTNAVIGAPMAAASLAGQAVGKQASRIVTNELAKKAVAASAAAATEAALYNIGANISEQALGDEDYSAEKLLAHSGSALALGAGLGLGGVAVGAIASKAKNALSRVKDLVNNRVAATTESLAGAESVLDNAADTYAAASSKVTGLPKEQINRFTGMPGTAEGMAARESALNKLTREEKDAFVSAATKDYQEMFHEIGATAYDAERATAKAIDSALKNRPMAEIRTAADDMLGALKKDIGSVSKPSRDAVAGAIDDITAGAVGEKATARGVFDAANKAVGRIEKALAASKDPAEKVFLRGAKEQVAGFTQNPAIFGDAAAAHATAKEMAAIFDSLAAPGGAFAKSFGKSVNGSLQMDPAKIAAHIEKSIKSTGSLKNAILDDFFAKADEIVKLSDKQAAITASTLDTTALGSLTKKASDARIKAAERMKSDAFLDDAAAASTKGVNDLAAGALAGAVGGPLGVAAAVGYKLLKDPVLAGKTLLALERVMMSTEGRVAEAIQSLVKQGSRAGKLTLQAAFRASVPASVGAMRALLGDAQGEETARRKKKGETKRLADFRALGELLEQVAMDPNRAFERYDKAFSGLGETAPNIKASLVQKQLEAGAFLYSKLPKNPSKGQTLNPAINDWQPSDQEMAVFERYVKAAHDPLSVLEDLKAGTVTRQGVDTVKALYPQLYSMIQTGLVSDLSRMQVKLPYSQRLNLSVLFGLPVDDTMTPAFISQMQVFYAGKTQSASQGAQGKRGGAPPKLGSGFRKFSDSVMTETQKVSFGRGQ